MMKLSRKEQTRRKRISEGLKRHYVNKKRMDVTLRKRKAAKKGQETKFKKRMVGCVIVFEGREYAFMDRQHISALAIQEKLNLFPDKMYIIKLEVWLAVYTDRRSVINIISGNGTDSDITELVFRSHVTADLFWSQYYAEIRAYLDQFSAKGTSKYESTSIELRQIQVC